MASISFRLLLSTVLLVAATGLGGCMNSLNDRSYLGVTPPPASSAEQSQPSYNDGHGLNRQAWTPTVVHVPVDGTAHRPTYNSNYRHTRVSTRQRGDMPTTAAEALELDENSLSEQIEEVPLALGSAAIDAVSIPVGLVAYHQGKTRWSPDVSYERTRPAVPAAPATPETADVPQTAQQAPQATEQPTPSPAMGTMTPVNESGAGSQ